MTKTDKEYLEGMKEAWAKWMSDYNLNCNKIVEDEICNLPRIATALEIIGRTLVSIDEKLEGCLYTPSSNGIAVRIIQ